MKNLILLTLGLVSISIGIFIYLSSEYHFKKNDIYSEKINILRKENGVSEIKSSWDLYITAQSRSCYLYITGQWSHQGFSEWRELFLGNRSFYGENLARNVGGNNPTDLWFTSSSHKNNLLNPNYKYFGTGRCGNYVVQHYSN